jgi:hypothetical protein
MSARGYLLVVRGTLLGAVLAALVRLFVSGGHVCSFDHLSSRTLALFLTNLSPTDVLSLITYSPRHNEESALFSSCHAAENTHPTRRPIPAFLSI